MLERPRAIEIIVDHRDDAAIVTGPGATAGGLWRLGDEPATIYNMELGYAAPISLGIALTDSSREAWSMEGEGSALAGISAFMTAARYGTENFCGFIFDNRVYGTGGAQVQTPTAFGLELDALLAATGFGSKRVLRAETEKEVVEAVVTVNTEPGPWAVVMPVDPGDLTGPQRKKPTLDNVECVVRCRNALLQG